MLAAFKNTIERNVLLMVFFNAFATPLMLSATNVALPNLANELQLTAVQLSWVPMIYLMAGAMFVLSFGRLADMFGRKRIFILGSASLVISSILAALADSAVHLLAARCLQGVSAGMLYATQIAIISSVFMPPRRGKMIGLTVSIIYFGLTLGPFLGGYLIDQYGWRSSFLFHIPIALLSLFYALVIVKEEWKSEVKLNFDYTGSILYALAIIILCVAVSLLPNLYAYTLIIVSLLFFISFYFHQKNKTIPLLDVNLLSKSRLFSMSCLASLLIYTAIFANVVLISLYLQYIKNESAIVTGVIMMLQPLAMAIVSPLAGKYIEHIEARYLATTGLIILTIALFMLSQLGWQTSTVYIAIALTLTGVGFGLFSSPNVSVIMGAVDKRYLGSANAVVATMRVVGQLTSMILVTSCMTYMIGNKTIADNLPSLLEAIHLCFFVAIVCSVVAALFSFTRGEQTQSP